MPRPSRLALIALLAATAPAAAQDDFWISVGSFKSFDAAQRLQAQAALALAEPVQMLPAEVAGRNVFRVVGGPYASRATAADHARNAQTSGYPDAWVLQAPSFATTAAPTAGTDALPGLDALPDVDALPDLETLPDVDALPDIEAVPDGLASANDVNLALDAAGVTPGDGTGLDEALADDVALDLDFDDLASFDDFTHLAALDDLDDFDDLENLDTAPPATPPARQRSFIETTEEPAWEAPPGFTLHRLPGPGDGEAAVDRSFPAEPAGPEGGRRVMCKLVGWLPFVKSCDER